MKEKKIEYPVRISKDEIEDMRLWDILLEQAHEGISMNGLKLQNPTHMGFSDSCPLGLKRPGLETEIQPGTGGSRQQHLQ